MRVDIWNACLCEIPKHLRKNKFVPFFAEKVTFPYTVIFRQYREVSPIGKGRGICPHK